MWSTLEVESGEVRKWDQRLEFKLQIYLRVERAFDVARRNETFFDCTSMHDSTYARPTIALVELDHVQLFTLGHRNASFTCGCKTNEIQFWKSLKPSSHFQLTVKWIKRFASSERLDWFRVVIHVVVDVLIVGATLARTRKRWVWCAEAAFGTRWTAAWRRKENWRLSFEGKLSKVNSKTSQKKKRLWAW